MQVTVKTQSVAALVSASAGLVNLNGAQMLPHEAMMLATALEHAAESADNYAAKMAAQPLPLEGSEVAGLFPQIIGR